MAAQLPDLGVVTPGHTWTRFRERHSFATTLPLDVVVPAAVIVIVALLCFVGPAVAHIQGPLKGSLLATNLPPLSPGHLLGTNALGDDLLSLCLFGGRVSIEVGLGSVAIGLAVGTTLGVSAGFFGGPAEATIMRVLDMLLAFPSLVIAATITTYLGQNEHNVIFAIAFFTVPAMARLARASTLKIRERDYVAAARIAGRPPRAVVFRHILPNIAPQLMTFAILMIGNAILIEAALSFLGLGVPPPQPSWGQLISAGQNVLQSQSWLILEPGAFLFVTVLSLNLLGDALRFRWAQEG
jgi:peptide/nickel transport system permease protein